MQEWPDVDVFELAKETTCVYGPPTPLNRLRYPPSTVLSGIALTGREPLYGCGHVVPIVGVRRQHVLALDGRVGRALGVRTLTAGWP